MLAYAGALQEALMPTAKKSSIPAEKAALYDKLIATIREI